MWNGAWSADLSSSFRFVFSTPPTDSVKQSGGRVLVHCQAGISRSATICLAYLMHTQRFRLDEAFNFVKQRRNVISPNLAFMGQLLQYEVDILCQGWRLGHMKRTEIYMTVFYFIFFKKPPPSCRSCAVLKALSGLTQIINVLLLKQCISEANIQRKSYLCCWHHITGGSSFPLSVEIDKWDLDVTNSSW